MFQRPLLRKYLKAVNKDDNNPNAAFRFREANKMKTRRTQRNSEADNLEKVDFLLFFLKLFIDENIETGS